jgi:hypothetical protein
MTQIKNRRLWTAAIVAFVVALPALAQVEPDPLAGLDSYIEQEMDRWEIPGAAVQNLLSIRFIELPLSVPERSASAR